MDRQRGYYTDDLKVYCNYNVNPTLQSVTRKMERYRFFVLMKGDCSILYNGDELRLRENHLFFADNSAYYSYSFADGKPVEYLEIIFHSDIVKNTFDDDKFLRSLNQMPNRNRVIDLNSDKFTALSRTVQGLIKCINRGAGRAHLIPRLYSIISELDFYYDEISGKREKVFKDNLPITIVEYVKHHFTEKITYKTISDKFFVSKPTIIKIFKAYSDCTMHEYIQELRLNCAINLINNNTNVVTAAKMSGFEYYSTFLRTYKAHYGALPADEIKNRRHTNS